MVPVPGCFQGKICETIDALALGYSNYDVFFKENDRDQWV
jgi:hypothetical protein